MKTKQKWVAMLVVLLIFPGAVVTVLGGAPDKVWEVTKVADTNDGSCDSDDCSLREAIAAASPGDTINFHSSLAGLTITIGSTLTLDKNLTIDGSSLSAPIAISGNNVVRVFIVDSGVTASLTSLTISNGYVVGSGGGIDNNGTLWVVNSTVSGNTADNNFGGGIQNDGTLNIVGSTFSYNSANHGGGIHNFGELFITNSTFYANEAFFGGGLHNDDEKTTSVVNSTFSGNLAGAENQGGGIWNEGALDFLNTILANSVIMSSLESSSVDCYNNGGTIVGDYNNLIENNGLDSGACGTPLVTADPRLGRLADNGGPTWTMALLSGSPAIDAGKDDACPSSDQRGSLRPFGAHCDIGAYEAQAPSCFVNNSGQLYSSEDESALQDAVNTSSAGDLLKVAGTCAGVHLQGDQTQTVYISQTLTIQGGYTTTNWTISDPRLYRTTLDAEELGRVVYISDGVEVTLDSLDIINGDTGGSGGGIFNDNGTLAIANSTLSGNTAFNGGGIWSDGTLTMTNSTLAGNTSNIYGGGIYNGTGGTLTIANSTLSGNRASVSPGGGISNSALLTMTNSTFSGNIATYGGGIHNLGVLHLTNTILANSNSENDCSSRNALATDINNLIETISPAPYDCGTPVVTADPRLGPLADNGGSTWTMALLSGSPAIDTGEDTACPEADQRGVFRPVGEHCDIGAFEGVLGVIYLPLVRR